MTTDRKPPFYMPAYWLDRKGYGPGAAILVTFFTLFVGQLVVAAVALSIYVQVSRKPAEAAIDSVTDSTFGQFVLMALAQIASFAIIYWFMRRRKITLGDIGLQRGPKLSDLGYAAIFVVVYFILLALTIQMVTNFIPAVNVEQEQQIGFETTQGFIALLLVFCSLVVFPPIIEEIMIRGFLYTGLRQKWNRLISTVVASAIFGFAHLQLFTGASPLYIAAIDTFVLSVVLILLREKTQSLWAGMVVHAIKNGLAFIALFVFKTR